MLNYPQVDLDFMNHDHAEFCTLRERLLTALSAMPDTDAIDVLLEHLLTHTRTHFAEEERWMRQTGFPPYPVHKSEHDRVIKQLSAKILDWRQQRDAPALAHWLEQEMGEWFSGHVSTMDMVTARFIRQALQQAKPS